MFEEECHEKNCLQDLELASRLSLKFNSKTLWKPATQPVVRLVKEGKTERVLKLQNNKEISPIILQKKWTVDTNDWCPIVGWLNDIDN